MFSVPVAVHRVKRAFLFRERHERHVVMDHGSALARTLDRARVPNVGAHEVDGRRRARDFELGDVEHANALTPPTRASRRASYRSSPLLP
jgi:hypothetical protein